MLQVSVAAAVAGIRIPQHARDHRHHFHCFHHCLRAESFGAVVFDGAVAV